MKVFVEDVLKQNTTDWNWGKSDLVNKMKSLAESKNLISPHWLFTRTELLQFNLDYLKVAIERQNPKRYNRTVSVLMHGCYDPEDGRISKKAIEMVKNFLIENNLISSLFYSFVGRWVNVGASYETATYVISADWTIFFKSIEDLEQNVNDSGFIYKEEYLKFIKTRDDHFTTNTKNDRGVEYLFTSGFMKELNDFWRMYNDIPEMPLK